MSENIIYEVEYQDRGGKKLNQKLKEIIFFKNGNEYLSPRGDRNFIELS